MSDNRTVIQVGNQWGVLSGDTVVAGPFDTMASAWRWIDRDNGDPVGRKEAAHDWSTTQWLKS